MTRRPRRMGCAVIAAVVLAAAGCRAGGAKTLPVAPAGPRTVYVALGNGETAGNGASNRIRDAWPQLVFRTSFARSAVFTNFGQNDATVAEAMSSQLAPALAQRPTVATVHLTEDVFLTRDPVAYQRNLMALVEQLQRGGRTAVVLGNLLPEDSEPGVRACLPDPAPGLPRCRLRGPDDLAAETARTPAFNAAVAAVARRTGATLVDLHAAFLAERAAGREAALWAGNDFSPNDAGHAFMARQFERGVKTALESRR